MSVVGIYLIKFNLVGSGGFKVFHPMVFQRVIESLHLNPEYEKSKCVTVTMTTVVSNNSIVFIHVLGIAQKQQRKKQQEQSKKTTKGKRKRRAAATALLVEEESMDTEEISESEYNKRLESFRTRASTCP